MKKITAKQLRKFVNYDPETGSFTRLYGPTKGIPTFGAKQKIHNITYAFLSVKGFRYLAHRLAWLYVRGSWPKGEIDHINGEGSDNRIVNLRDCSRGENATNSLAQKSNKVGLRGVHYHPEAKRYRAQICKYNKTRHIGYFDTPEEAHRAYLAEAVKVHGEFVRIPEGRRV